MELIKRSIACVTSRRNIDTPVADSEGPNDGDEEDETGSGGLEDAVQALIPPVADDDQELDDDLGYRRTSARTYYTAEDVAH